MNHNDIRHKLSEYIDGAVTAGEKAEIEEHLKSCSQCSDALAELWKTIEAVRQVEEAEPPAWMTSKIMARIRAEAEQKKSVFQRLFYPLAIKVPLQTVAVLFLVVTAFYIYRSIQPEMRYAEAPAPVSETKKEAPSPGKLKGAIGRAKEPSPRQQPPQSPEYRSLDMKYAYEKPAPPVPKEEESLLAKSPEKGSARDVIGKQETYPSERMRVTVAPSAKAEQKTTAHREKSKASPGTKSEIISILHKMIELNNDYLSSVSTGIGRSGKSYTVLHQEGENYHENFFIPALKPMKEIICRQGDKELLSEYFKVLIATTNSSDEMPSWILGDIYLCQPELTIETYKDLKKEEKQIIFGELQFGFENVTYNKEHSITNYPRLKKMLDTLKPAK